MATSRSGEVFGHPTCLFTLFFAEMWERFSFYGMKALLILYMVNYLFWRQGEASTVMAWYAGLVYATPVLGGIVADKLTGARWAVVIGGVIIAIGHFLLAFEPLPFFYSGLACLVVGTGFLKPNISTQVGALYRSKDERRDSAFTIFYMGINLGAFLGPLVCGWLRLNYNYHYGFAAAGVGMVIGLIVYILGMGSVVRREKQIAAEEAAAEGEEEASATPAAPTETGAPAVDEPAAQRPTAPPTEPGRIPDPNAPSQAKIYFDRSMVLVVICVFAILFWVGFEQAANVMNLWADKHTNLFVFQGVAPEATVADRTPAPVTGGDVAPAAGGGGLGNFQMTAEMTQSINPFFIITLAAVFAWFWQFLEKRGRQPSTPVKMMFGVFFLSCAYGIMLMAAQAENQKSSAPLAELPQQLLTDPEGHVYELVEEDVPGKEIHVVAYPTSDPEVGEPEVLPAVIDEDGYVRVLRQEPVYFGATRLRYDDNTLVMNGVLTDLDWMRVLGATSNETYEQTIDDLLERIETRAEEVRVAKQAGEMPRDATWEVTAKVPPEAGEVQFLAGLPTQTEGTEETQVAFWDADTRTIRVTATLSAKDEAQLRAAGADPRFRDAVTEIYQESSVLKVSIAWLLAFYLVITVGELCLSPVGLSLVTKAAPPKYVGLFMGFWFFTTGAVSNFLAHYVGGYWGTMTPGEYFMIFGVLGLIATVIMLLLIRVLKPLLHGIH